MLARLKSAVVAVAAAALFLLLLWLLVLVLPPLSLPLVLPPLLVLRPLCMRSPLFPAVRLCPLGCTGSRLFVCSFVVPATQPHLFALVPPFVCARSFALVPTCLCVRSCRSPSPGNVVWPSFVLVWACPRSFGLFCLHQIHI